MNEATEPNMVGHNNPPTPFEEVTTEIEDYFLEASNWLDGNGVRSDTDEEAVATLQNLLLKAKKKADDLRKTEKKPFDDGAKAVQVKFKPLISRAELAIDTCRKALTPWLEKKESERRAEAERLRKEAEAKEAEARAAVQSAPVDHLTAREEAESKIEAAKEADRIARAVENKSTNAKNNAGRAVGLRIHYIPELIDPVAAIKHYWPNEAINALLLKLAGADVRAGKREIPGFEIKEEKRAA